MPNETIEQLKREYLEAHQRLFNSIDQHVALQPKPDEKQTKSAPEKK